MAAKQSTGNVDAKGAGVHSLRHDEPDGCGVGVPHELRSQVLQGEGGDAVSGRGYVNQVDYSELGIRGRRNPGCYAYGIHQRPNT